MEQLQFDGGTAVTAIAFIYTVLLGPICEELTFRGLTFNLARRSVGDSSANILQAVLFAGMHANPMQSAYTFVFGYLLGKIYNKTNNLVICIAIHICFNAMGMLFGDLFVVGNTPIMFYAILFLALSGTYVGYDMIFRAENRRNPA